MAVKLSFIIPVYNLRKWIKQCLDSILSLKIDSSLFEVIIWDDGSSDDSYDIIVSYCKNHSNIRIASEKNHGVSYARNQALKLATGEYVWFVDGDDFIESQSVSNLISFLETEDADMIYFGWRAFDGYNYSPGIYIPLETQCTTGKLFFLSQRLMMAPWCYIYRRNFILDNHLCFEVPFRTCEDILFTQKSLLLANRVVLIPDVLYTYRLQVESASQGERRSTKVLRDQVRRIFPEISYFGSKKEWRFLCRVLLLNVKDILFWTKKSFSVKL